MVSTEVVYREIITDFSKINGGVVTLSYENPWDSD